MPFRDSSIKTLIKDQREPLHIPSAMVKTFDESLKDLLTSIMFFDLAKRYGMKEIKAHPWFKVPLHTTEASTSSLSSSNSGRPTVALEPTSAESVRIEALQ